MHFDGDAFISYAHLDNQELVEGRKGWVANLHRALEIRVGQLLGKAPQIWRDPKLQGNDVFAETLIERLRRVAVLVAVVSPRYIRSEWTRRELETFWKAAEQQGGVSLDQKARIFKVLKTPVPLDAHPPELRPLLGYEFFRIDPETGRVRELDEVFGPEAQREFWIRLDDLAHEICALLERLEGPDGGAAASTGTAAAPVVYLAETTSDLRESRGAIRRDLQQHGCQVLPAAPLPQVADELRAAVAADLARCAISVHLFGANYGIVPEGAAASLAEIQNELAAARARDGGLARLLWIPQALVPADERQAAVLERLRNDPRMAAGDDLLESPFEDVRTLIHDRLQALREPPAARPDAAVPPPPNGMAQPVVYVIYDQRDGETAGVWADLLFDAGAEVLHPVFEGDEAEVREYHEENLRVCDGVALCYGSAGEIWVRRKLREIQKMAGCGRTKAAPAVTVCLLPPATPEKLRFRTHEATLEPLSGGPTPAAAAAFMSRLNGRP